MYYPLFLGANQSRRRSFPRRCSVLSNISVTTALSSLFRSLDKTAPPCYNRTEAIAGIPPPSAPSSDRRYCRPCASEATLLRRRLGSCARVRPTLGPIGSRDCSFCGVRFSRVEGCAFACRMQRAAVSRHGTSSPRPRCAWELSSIPYMKIDHAARIPLPIKRRNPPC